MHHVLPPILMASLDALGSFVFALSGAALAIQKRFDIFGVLFLAFVVAAAGGITRDVLIGAVPPASIANWHTFAIAIGGGLLTFYSYSTVESLNRPVLLFDAIGLGVFAVTGAEKALSYGINPLMAAALGMLSGIGGGMVRDVLAREVPFVLRADLYAVAALAAGGVVSVGHEIGSAPIYSMVAGFVVCVFLRLMAIYRGWRAPVARWSNNANR